MPTTTRSASRVVPSSSSTARTAASPSDAAHAVPEGEARAVLRVARLHDAADVRAEDALERRRLRPDHRDVQAAVDEAGRGLHADEARADHDGALGAVRGGDQRLCVLLRAQREDARQVRARHGQAARPGAARDEHRVRRHGASVVEREHPRGDVEVRHARDEALDRVLLVELGRAQGQPLGLKLAGEEVLAQVGTVVGPVLLWADHHDAADEEQLAERLGGGRCRGAGADDRDHARVLLGIAGVHRHGAAATRLLRAVDVHVVAVDAHAEGGDAVQRGRLEQVAGAHVVGGLVPGAQQPRAVQRALGQRPAPVRAAGRGRVEAARRPWRGAPSCHRRARSSSRRPADPLVPATRSSMMSLPDRGSGRAPSLRRQPWR